jgi:hypothetical protein
MQLYYLLAIKENNSDELDNLLYHYRNKECDLLSVLKPIINCRSKKQSNNMLCSCCSCFQVNDKIVSIVEKIIRESYN